MTKRVTPRTRTSGARPSVRPRDPFALYEVAVQGVDWDLDFLERVWRYRHPGHAPKLFREDFCGTAALSAAWAARGRDRRAWGVDLDARPLEWARRHRLPWLRDAAGRVKLVRGDVRHARRPQVDVPSCSAICGRRAPGSSQAACSCSTCTAARARRRSSPSARASGR